MIKQQKFKNEQSENNVLVVGFFGFPLGMIVTTLMIAFGDGNGILTYELSIFGEIYLMISVFAMVWVPAIIYGILHYKNKFLKINTDETMVRWAIVSGALLIIGLISLIGL